MAGLQLSPSGDTAIVLHSKESNGELTAASPFYNEDAITLVDLGDHFANPIRLPDAPSGFAVTDDGQLYVWGRGNEGQLGLGACTSTLVLG